MNIFFFEKEGACWPSFFLFPALCFILFTSIFASSFNYFTGITCLLLLLLFRLPESIVRSPITIATLLYCFFVFFNLFFIDTVHVAREFYYAGFLLVGFVVFNKLHVLQIAYAYRWLLLLLILLAFWGVVQFHTGDFYIAGNGRRANTIFYTPNTFAASINLVLFPLIAVFLTSDKSRLNLTVIISILFYTLLLTKSRGGWLSFSLGLGLVIFLYLFVNRKHIKRLMFLMTILTITTLIYLFSHNIKNVNINEMAVADYFQGIDLQHVTRTKKLTRLAVNRLVLYEKAWERIKQKPLIGHGYHNFQYYWLKDQEAPFKNNHTDFVHNDYLQIWMETGVFALLSILSLILFFYYGLFRFIRDKSNYRLQHLSYVLALAGGLTAFFSHAMVDFVFYPCFLVLIFSAYLAVANKVLFAKYAQRGVNDAH